MPLRDPVRPLAIGDIAYAFPREMLVDFSTGSITFLDDSLNQILNKNPGKLTIKAGTATILDNADLSNTHTITLAAVASSGKYSDLTDIPKINGKILSTDITLSASDVGALSSDTLIPTNTSQLINDSGFLTEHQDISGKQDKLIGTAGQIVGFDSNGNPIAQKAVKSAYQSASEAGYSGTETAFNTALSTVPDHIDDYDIHVTAHNKAIWYGKADKSSIVEYTMTAADWDNDQYSFEAIYPSDTYNLSLSLSGYSTEDQEIAFLKAKLRGSASGNIAIAKGIVPTVDIPVILEVVTK